MATQRAFWFLSMIMVPGTQTPLYGRQTQDVSLGVGAGYVYAFGTDGLGAQIDARLSLPATMLGVRPAIGLEAWIFSVATHYPATLSGFGVHPRAEWSLADGRVRPHISVSLGLMHAERHSFLVCLMRLDGNECLPNSDTGVGWGVATGFHVTVFKGLDAALEGSRLWNNLYWASPGALWAVRAGLAYRWHWNVNGRS